MHYPSCVRTQQELSVICYMSAAIAPKCAAKHHGVVKTPPATAGVSPALPVCRDGRKERAGRPRSQVCAVFGFNLDSRQVARLAKFCLDSSSRANHRSAARSSEK
jgi:hypothetical protein